MVMKVVVGTLLATIHSFWLMTTFALSIAVIERWLHRFTSRNREQPATTLTPD